MAGPLTVRAPVRGVVVSLDAVGDEVFAAGMLGAGCAIDPDPRESGVVAPISGVLAALHPHAFVVQAGERSVLVHLGVDTVQLDGVGFTEELGVGATVRAGDVVVRWDVPAVAKAGLGVKCPVVALQAPSEAVRWLVGKGAAVAVGDPILEWL